MARQPRHEPPGDNHTAPAEPSPPSWSGSRAPRCWPGWRTAAVGARWTAACSARRARRGPAWAPAAGPARGEGRCWKPPRERGRTSAGAVVLRRAAPHRGGGTHPLPLGVDDLRGDRGVGVVPPQLDAVEVGDALRLPLDAQDGLALLVGVGQGGLELVVRGDEALQETGASSEPGFGGLCPSTDACPPRASPPRSPRWCGR